MKRSIIFLALLAILTIGTLSIDVNVDDVTIKDILDYPYEFMSGNVRVKGTVWPGEQGEASGYYFIIDSSGSKIKVIQRIKAYPRAGQLYTVSAVVNFSNDKREIIMTEFQREPWYANGAPIGADIYILAVIAAGLLGYIGYLLYQMATRKVTPDDAADANDKIPGGALQPVINKPPEKTIGHIIQLISPPEETCKLLEGRFLILKGDNIIKGIRFIRPLSQDTIEYTFGRKDTDVYTDIRLRTASVATKQATLRNSQDDDDYDGDGTYTLINHARAEATPTKVNGKPMDDGEEFSLSEGDKIEMGVVVFAFTKED